MALTRRLPSDDQWVVPHNLYVHLRLRPSLYKIRAFCMERPCYVQVSMFNPSTINVICFDPNHNSDQARGYAAKYCSKPEKWWANLCRAAPKIKFARVCVLLHWFYMETQQENGLKAWLQGRVVGLCMTWARLLQHHIVRSTRAVVWTPPKFVEPPGTASLRTDDHLVKAPEYPDPKNYVSYIGKYLFRRAARFRVRPVCVAEVMQSCVCQGQAASSPEN